MNNLFTILMSLQLHFRMAGLIVFSWKTKYSYYHLHFIIANPSLRQWGRKEDWYDGPLISWGLGGIASLYSCEV
jgi:hypothetical protein